MKYRWSKREFIVSFPEKREKFQYLTNRKKTLSIRESVDLVLAGGEPSMLKKREQRHWDQGQRTFHWLCERKAVSPVVGNSCVAGSRPHLIGSPIDFQITPA